MNLNHKIAIALSLFSATFIYAQETPIKTNSEKTIESNQLNESTKAAIDPLCLLIKSVPIKNASFDEILPETGSAAARINPIPGWYTKEHVKAGSYTFTIDENQKVSKPASLRIQRVNQEQPFGVIEQNITPIPSCWFNKTARLSAKLKTENISGEGAGLTLQILRLGSILKWNHMFDSLIKGTSNWKYYSIDLKIPENTHQLNLGAMLQDNGTLWIDDFKLEIVD